MCLMGGAEVISLLADSRFLRLSHTARYGLLALPALYEPGLPGCFVANPEVLGDLVWPGEDIDVAAVIKEWTDAGLVKLTRGWTGEHRLGHLLLRTEAAA